MLMDSNLQWIRVIAAMGSSGALRLPIGVIVGPGAVLLLAPQSREEAAQSLRFLFRGQ